MSMLRIGILLGCSFCISMGFADAQTATIEFKVEIDRAILGTPSTRSVDDSGEDFFPGENVFIYVPPTNQVRKHGNFKDWLLQHTQKSAPKRHQFEVVGQSIRPRAVLAKVGDAIDRLTQDKQPITLHVFNNTPISVDPTAVPLYHWGRPETLPIEVSTTPPTSSAYILVLDHGCSCLTDSDGIAQLDQLPKGMKISLRVNIPHVKSPIQFDSDSLNIAPNGTFSVSTGKTLQRHKIRILRSSSP